MQRNESEKIALCAIARLENDYIEEWLEHHLALGFVHIFIYDNYHNDEPQIKDVIDALNNKWENRITIIEVPDKKHCQMEIYNDCYRTYGKEFGWMAFWDIDEFFVFNSSTTYKNINEYLKTIKPDADGILINWRVFGDNGQLYNDKRKVMERFPSPLPAFFSIHDVWGRYPCNNFAKSIIRTEKDIVFKSPHCATGLKKTVNSDNVIIQNGDSIPFTHNTCYLNHYIRKSITEFLEIKQKRGGGAGKQYNLESFFLFNKPTIAKLYIYRNACKKIGVKPCNNIKFWVKTYLKMYITMPILQIIKKRNNN